MLRLKLNAKLNNSSDSLNLPGTQRLPQMKFMKVFVESYVGDSEAVLIAGSLKHRKYKEINLSSTLTLSFIFRLN